VQWLALALLAALLLGGCGEGGNDDDSPADDDEATAEPCEPMPTSMTIGPSDRPAELQGPPGWCSNRPIPVIFLLHGYGASAQAQDFLFRLSSRVEQDYFLLVLPNGTYDPTGRRFWNGPPGCCNFYGSNVDDVGYLTGLIDELEEVATISPDEVYFAGHSNGGFMSYRMAKEKPERLGAIASLAGSGYPNSPGGSTEPVSVLQIHGENDSTIPYNGTEWYPGAEGLAERWAELADCDVSAAEQGTALDLVNSLPGAETQVLNYTEGCTQPAAVSLWTITEGSHVPYLNESFAEKLVSWLLSHPG
jgi:polyhydroxybutyrate depolymerase